MNLQIVGSYPTDDLNRVAAVFLEDIADQPVPLEAEKTLAGIRQAVAEQIATDTMIQDIIGLFRKEGAS